MRVGLTGRAAATYILLAGLQRGVSLLILPFITYAMSPVDYGAASMLTATSLLLTALISTPLVQIIIRAAARDDADSPALLRLAGVYCYMLLPALVVVASTGVALFVPQLLGVPGHIWAIELVAIGLQPATATFGLWVAQAREDLRRFILLSSVSVISVAVFKLLFVVALRLGVMGWVLADVASALIAAVTAWTLVRLPRADVSPRHIRYALGFTMPLIPHSASLWALNSVSRPAMAAVSTLEQVGLLSFGLSLAQLAGLVLAETNRAVLPRYAREAFPAPTGQTTGPVRWQVTAAFVVPAVVGCGVALVGRWFFAAAYWPSFGLTGALLLGQAAYGLYLIPMNYLTQTAAVPRYSALASGVGAATILILIPLVGPRHGAVGVAWATAAAFLAMAAVAMVLTVVHKLDIAWRVWRPYWAEFLPAAAALTCALAALGTPTGSTAGWVFAAAGLLLAALATASTGTRTVREHR